MGYDAFSEELTIGDAVLSEADMGSARRGEAEFSSSAITISPNSVCCWDEALGLVSAKSCHRVICVSFLMHIGLAA